MAFFVPFPDNMIMAMSLKPAPNLAIISIYRMKIHWAVAKLRYFYTLLMIEIFL